MAANSSNGWTRMDEETYQELSYRAEQQARELYRQSEEYRSRRGEGGNNTPDGCAVQSEPARQPQPTARKMTQTLQEEGWQPCTDLEPIHKKSADRAEAPNNRRTPTGRNNVSRQTNNIFADKEILLILALMFILWKEKADKEILLALLYILAV